MRFLLGFLFGASYSGNRAFRVAFLLILLFLAFCLYQMSKPLGRNGRVTQRSAQVR
jgi:HAMP domain-containing protein